MFHGVSPCHNNFHEAYIKNLLETYFFPSYVNSPRGFKSRERLNISFLINNPRERVCYLPSRAVNIVFNFAEVLWHLSGSNDLSYMMYYSKNFYKYSNDGITLTGSAYGPKIFSFGESKVNQWAKIIDLLSRDDVDSKRAVIQIFDPNEPLTSDNIDLACTTNLQFFVRNAKLHMTCNMRANDAYRGIVSDVFCFTLIQEIMANQLGIELGEYYHQVSSMDIFETDIPYIRKIIDEIQESPGFINTQYIFPTLPVGNNWTSIATLLDCERKIREDGRHFSHEEIEKMALPEFWKQVLLLFVIYRNIFDSQPTQPAILEKLNPIYHYFLNNKWPERFSGSISIEKLAYFKRNGVVCSENYLPINT